MIAAIFAVLLVLATVGIVSALAAAIEVRWLDERIQVTRCGVLAIAFFLLADEVPPTLGSLMLLVGIGLGLRPFMRRLAGLHKEAPK